MNGGTSRSLRAILPRVSGAVRREDAGFSEEAFYLKEFRGRTLGIAVPGQDDAHHPELARVLARLADNATRTVLVLGPALDPTSLALPMAALDVPRFPGQVWRTLKHGSVVAVPAVGTLATAVLEAATRLGLFKVVRLAPIAGVRDPGGERRSFVHVSELGELRHATPQHDPLHDLLLEIEGLLLAGIPSVNVCTVAGLGDELFSYAGSGTLFTRERYVHVRRFGIEDFDAAADLIARGTAEGYLAPRSDAQIDHLLADGFGAFVGGEHLAGIGALRVPANAEAGEVASLYTLTRFAGGGIGRHLVAFAIKRAREQGLRFVYACTTFESVGLFFEKQGFTRVDGSRVPEEKWQGYDEARRTKIRCYRLDL